MEKSSKQKNSRAENPSERKAYRILEIEAMLLEHPEGMLPAEIARRLGVNRSTIGRYTPELPKHIYIDIDDGGRWKIDRSAYLVNVRFNLHEALAVHLAARLLASRMDRQNPHAAAALRKLGVALERLAPHISAHLGKSADAMDDDTTWSDPGYLQVLETLSIAWAEGRKVKVWHRQDPEGKVLAYTFSPYFIEPYAVGQSTHAIGLREPPGRLRTFKIERIERAELLREPYTIPPDFDARVLLADAWGIWYTDEEPVEVALKFHRSVAGRVKESRWHRSQEVTEQEDGSLIWRARVAELRELIPWIRGWGADVEVLAPAWLRETLRHEQRRAAENYGWVVSEAGLPGLIVNDALDGAKRTLYYAHTRGNDKASWQTILQHLTATADLARTLGADSGLAEFAAAAAMLHDLGKYSREFQMRLEGSTQKVDHATAGAKEIERLVTGPGQALIGRLLAYCIAGHHGGLPDGGSPADTEDDPTLTGRLKRPLKDYSAYSGEIETARLSLPERFPAHFRPILEAQGFSVAFATRMIYSILVDADFLDTETFCNGGRRPRGEYSPIPVLAEQFARHLRRFDHPTREIDLRRTGTLRACVAQAGLPPGLFTLTLPTGAGKTLTSMAFAMQHAIQHGLKRIIYVIPYTSIIEQNAAVFKTSLEGYENHVLEHHSTFEWNPKREEGEAGREDSPLARLKWAAENWDVPLVVTTNVQFFESLFASRSSRSRKIHNLAKTVIIFDEAQTLPREFMLPSIYSVVELVRNYGASAVFCTATQPALERFLPKGVTLRELIPQPQAEFDFYRRVQVRQAGRLTDAEVLERLNSHPQVLCIVNTRKHAKALFEGLKGEGCFHLSTLMCAAHRRAVIAEIRHRLAEGLECRVVSTQLLEAGVDLDFPVGYRALAGLESIIQSAGRVNRENRRPTGELFVFEPDSEFARHVPNYIQQTADVARIILQKYASSDPVCLEAIHSYFNLLYGVSAPIAFDSRGILTCFEKRSTPPSFDFATAAEKFKLIDQDTIPVIIPYDETARSLLSELETSAAPLGIIRKLQPYTVNIYQKEYQALEGNAAIILYAETYAALNEAQGQYDANTGLALSDRHGGYGVFLDQ